MTRPVLIALPGNDARADRLAAAVNGDRIALHYRRFPDGESYLRIDAELTDRDVVLVATLDRPDPKIPRLLFAADLVRDLGARSVLLVAPYLPYMRQDHRFHPGEALTSVSFAERISAAFDGLVTVDPHLHRYPTLDAVYSIPGRVVAAAPALAAWIAASIEQPLVVGPDEESEQWVRAVAEARGLPWRVMTKQRFGDHDVRITAPSLAGLDDRRPVLVDDILSSGATLADAARVLVEAGLPMPACAVVHGLFGDRARETLAEAGIETVVCSDTVDAPEARIDLAERIAPAVRELLESC
ncbi:ribose-phosphate diphosphokinase [Wenzhouxiangella sp. XN79A]|uniref:ribose-phosphate diphosphokinase n=1 Tax=Wenzhouxiangella sp. XN79A TaxID=2724193 RepID=UPI00144A549A|nr:ribose-phosphate diphosphokinase [Wenzhouxiangella sp. XN79A]NKI33835.1 ribose-phosphate diphosphokinase [Wenzhouxiangella sp. XN79A]